MPPKLACMLKAYHVLSTTPQKANKCPALLRSYNPSHQITKILAPPIQRYQYISPPWATEIENKPSILSTRSTARTGSSGLLSLSTSCNQSSAMPSVRRRKGPPGQDIWALVSHLALAPWLRLSLKPPSNRDLPDGYTRLSA